MGETEFGEEGEKARGKPELVSLCLRRPGCLLSLVRLSGGRGKRMSGKDG